MATDVRSDIGDIYKIDVHPCTTCDGYEESACCGALIIKHDICSDCGEHCESKCEDCEFKFL